MCELLHTSLVVQKCNVAKKPVELAIRSGSCRERKRPQPLDGQGKLAERNETSSSALPALQHLLGGLRAEHPLVALPTFWVLFIQKFARRARAPKLLIYFGPGARDRRRTTDVGALKDAPSIMSDEFDSLDATEKAAIRATLIRCRVLAAKIANELRNKKPQHFVDKSSLAQLYASLEHAAGVLEQKRR